MIINFYIELNITILPLDIYKCKSFSGFISLWEEIVEESVEKSEKCIELVKLYVLYRVPH